MLIHTFIVYTNAVFFFVCLQPTSNGYPLIRVKKEGEILQNVKREASDENFVTPFGKSKEEMEKEFLREINVADFLQKLLKKERKEIADLIKKVIKPSYIAKLKSRGFDSRDMVKLVKAVKQMALRERHSDTRKIANLLVGQGNGQVLNFYSALDAELPDNDILIP